MKRLLSLLMTVSLVLSLFVGCSSTDTVAEGEDTAEKLSIVTTIFPVYDWVKVILGEEEADVIYLLDDGVDSHSYQPSTDDIVAISQCDVFIYVGGESDEWVDAVLENAINPDVTVLNLMEVLGDDALPEELVEGMEASDHDHDHDAEEMEDDHDHDAEEMEDDHDAEEAVADEHIWLSLKNAQILVVAIAECLSAVSPEGEADYMANIGLYLGELGELDGRYEEMVANAQRDVILFADRFPFLYMVNDYGLSYYAAFQGCSAETEASFETMVFLATKVDELGLTTILTIDDGDKSIAETVASTATSGEQVILSMNSLQSVDADDVANGESYLSAMVNNLAVLEQALN